MNLESPKEFYQKIPKTLVSNLKFREKLHSYLSTRPEEQDKFLEMCKRYWPIMFDCVFWTLNPNLQEGCVNQPFIIGNRPRQIKTVEVFQDQITKPPEERRDIGIEKSREEGATELSIKCFVLACMLYQYKNFICGSKTEEDVDKKGEPMTLFAKADHAIKTLPLWLRERLGCFEYKGHGVYDGIERTHLHIGFPYTNSSIDGESTNVNFAISKRATAVLLDEFGRVERNVAESIEGSVHDVSKIVVYSSTHWLGENHPFNLALRKPTTIVCQLPWYDNPTKNPGLYYSPEEEYIEIKDVDYYKIKYPGLYEEIKSNHKYHIKDLPSSGYNFIADAYKQLPEGACCRSPWHDTEYERRKENRRDFASNVWMSPSGASDSVFRHTTLNKIRSIHVREPDIIVNIDPVRESSGRVVHFKFNRRNTSGKLRWWGKLINNRPDQRHNYIIGADPSLGTGASNSVLQIYDTNTKEQVGVWADPNTEYSDFADITVAVCMWVGGDTDPFIVPERNGGHGINYINRILWNKYRHVYTLKAEDTKTRKRTKKYGWQNGRGSKDNLCRELDSALYEGVVSKSVDYVKIIVHDEDTVSELYDYMFLDNGSIEASKKSDETSGARERHGDRVISLGLCILGCRDKKPANIQKPSEEPEGECFAKRFADWEREQEKLKREMRQFRW